jgi:hypothetical protein
MVVRGDGRGLRPVPWAWIIRVALSLAASVTWAVLHPHASDGTEAWQCLLVSLAVIIAAEGLQAAYRREQGRIRGRKS